MLNRSARLGRTRQASRGNSRCSALATTSLRLPDICNAVLRVRPSRRTGGSPTFLPVPAAPCGVAPIGWVRGSGRSATRCPARRDLPGDDTDPDHQTSRWKQEQQPAVRNSVIRSRPSRNTYDARRIDRWQTDIEQAQLAVHVVRWMRSARSRVCSQTKATGSSSDVHLTGPVLARAHTLGCHGQLYAPATHTCGFCW